jgi:hypothetical protein
MTYVTRFRLPAVLITLGLVVALVPVLAAAKPDPKPKPPKPKPQVALLTNSQEGALRKREIKVDIESRRGDKASGEATLVVDGAPAEDYVFKLGPERAKLREGEAKLRFALSARKREVLEFASLTCRAATVDVRAEVTAGERTGAASDAGHLKRPADCRSGG